MFQTGGGDAERERERERETERDRERGLGGSSPQPRRRRLCGASNFHALDSSLVLSVARCIPLAVNRRAVGRRRPRRRRDRSRTTSSTSGSAVASLIEVPPAPSETRRTVGGHEFPSFSSSHSQRPLSSYSVTGAPNKPAWTHQPSPAAVATAAAAGPDLACPTLHPWWVISSPVRRSGRICSWPDQGGNSSKVPLKATAPKNSYSMGSMSDSLPKTTTAGAYNSGNSNSRGSADNMGSYYPKTGSNVGSTIGNSWGARPMKSSGAAPSAKQDPFGSLVDFGSKPSSSPSPAVGSSFASKKTDAGNFSFGGFQDANPQKTAGMDATLDGFGMPSFQDLPSKNSPQQPKVDADPLDALFSSIGSSGTAAAAASAEGAGSQPLETNDWDLGAEFGAEGLPPPPAGVSSSIAKSKGSESYKQGQFADGIKWLSWAVLLLDKSGDTSAIMEVLTCRASCYKEVGEYKKAIADCSKILEHDSRNVAALVQRALLYESIEKYKLGAEDLRAVLKIDPQTGLQGAPFID
ncbi:unnamed protein product [Spirodela intermedia]|uniref:Uncharacterized protein n=1 Tax=Spirodela intermedia TaxID=51605 RepID=A0A7I8IBC1_SPIIN|nr:unnamed protein product [Spirodela intermedia]CAA6654332.1 unnamed protein product [Spirodela intermedia]